MRVQALLWAAMDGWKQERVEYAVAAVPGGRALPLSHVQNMRRKALLRLDEVQQRTEIRRAAEEAGARWDSDDHEHCEHWRTHLQGLQPLRLIARLGRRVLLGRCAGSGSAMVQHSLSSSLQHAAGCRPQADESQHSR